MRAPVEADRDPNKHWLGEVQPIGIVVTASALAAHALVPAQQTKVDTEAVLAHLNERDQAGPALRDPWAFLSEILDWRVPQVAGSPGGPDVPDALRVPLSASETVLEPHLAVVAPGGDGWQLLIRTEALGVEPDKRGALPGWEATPHQRFERLLRDTGVPTGLLVTDETLRMVYAPKGGESSGWFEVPLRALGTVAGRSMLGGLKLLLDRYRLFGDAAERRLPALSEASRRSQAEVSTKLATQVLGALHALMHGLHAASPTALSAITRDQPAIVYEGLLAVLLRLVFLLYAEDRGLIPSRDDAMSRAFYDQGYGVRALHTRLLEDAALHPDTMEERRGAWHRLLALFRLVHAGDTTGWMRGRGGKLFDPASFPFLQGQTVPTDPIQVPLVSDGCVLRVLDGLLTLDGERLSYRALDVEQIGSVYETVMGFTAQIARGPSIAIRAGKRDRTPVFVDLSALASIPAKDRLKWLKENTERGKFPSRTERAIDAAQDQDQLATALLEVVDERGSPGGRVCPAGTPLLQPTDERRRTGSHYTPRDLTAPIVLHALAPAFERIGAGATPEAVLSLKVCDPAMGSGAFLVEACRQLAGRLVEAWRVHPDKQPVLPPDEDEELHAKRLVAQRCLYGVDRNPMATDLARLSLWLATLARDHEFTFLDHALKSGDSLVGLTARQITALTWGDDRQASFFGNLVTERVAKVVTGRAAIRAAPDNVARAEQEARHVIVESTLADIRVIGDAVLGCFFAEAKPRPRQLAVSALQDLGGRDIETRWRGLRDRAAILARGAHPIQPFHWEVEFPEVFMDGSGGFDAIVGNPPFAGKNTLINGNRAHYLDWLQTLHEGAHGNADLVAHFFRRAFALLRPGGCLGLIATNTIGQGDTRESGLRAVIAAGGAITHATRRLVWPGEAAVVVSVVHVLNGAAGSAVLDGRKARRISAYLVEGDLDSSPAPLAENAGKAFQGAILLGLGFTFDDEAAAKGKASPVTEMHRLIAKDPRNAERIFPYLGGEEVNTDPRHAHRRWCIDFNDFPLRRDPNLQSWFLNEGTDACDKRRRDWLRSGIVPVDYPEPVAAEWPDLLEIVERLVKPERDPQKRDALRLRWWQYAEKRPGLRAAVAGLEWVFAATQTSSHLVVSRLPAGAVLDQSLTVLPDPDFRAFSVRQSRVQELWTRDLGATLEDRLRFTAADSGAPFPMPDLRSLVADKAEAYLDHRASLMVARNEGLTRIYNRFHNPDEHAADIRRLRDLHQEMDVFVLIAYGWNDLADTAAPEFLTEDTEQDHRYQGRLFWPASFRDEVLARLLALNAERAADEAARGLAPAPALIGANELEEV